MGSCFAESIGKQFTTRRFNTAVNPLGIVYNPLSLFDQLNNFIQPEKQAGNSAVHSQERYFSWKAHSHVFGNTETELNSKINSTNKAANQFLKQTNVLFITFGSAWAYKLKNNDQIVSNCHKQPSNLFEKILIDSSQITQGFEKIEANLKKLNPHLQLVFTVSPVRYFRDGIIESNRSKAELIKSVHQIVEQYENCHYLPSYEWIIDDLRDYRFFEADLTHPNELAIEYVWQKVWVSCCNGEVKKQVQLIHNLQRDVNHRAFNPSSQNHQKFLLKTHAKALALQQQLGIDLSFEIEKLNSQIIE